MSRFINRTSDLETEIRSVVRNTFPLVTSSENNVAILDEGGVDVPGGPDTDDPTNGKPKFMWGFNYWGGKATVAS